MRILATFIVAATVLAGCSLQIADIRPLPFSAITVHANSSSLTAAMQNELRHLTMDGDDVPDLLLEEQTKVAATAIAAGGHAAKRHLNYVLEYRLEDSGELVFTGEYKYRQILENNETTHRANRLANRRFFDQARQDGVEKIIIDLKHYTGQ